MGQRWRGSRAPKFQHDVADREPKTALFHGSREGKIILSCTPDSTSLPGVKSLNTARRLPAGISKNTYQWMVGNVLL
jgi:hypothetical protein